MARTVVLWVIEAYVVVLVLRALVSWFPPPMPGTPFWRLLRLIDRLTEPVLAPVRRALPPVRVGGMGLDLSILVVLILLQVVIVPLVLRLL
jgi:YggT family protein